MTQNRANPVVQRIGFAALLVVFLSACGGGDPPTTPPPPPPFRPQAVTVNLGDHGGSITLMTTQFGGYTRDGQAFTSGTEVVAENGSRYRVTLTGQTWSAEFLPPDAVEVQLGTSGDTVSITQLEDRSYQVDGQPLGEDRIVTADNGNMYRLTLDDTGWMWEFLLPDAVEVQLGTSGDTVSITQLEDRSYQVDGNALASGDVVEADNGNRYRLTLDDTGWAWEFLPPDSFSLDLGTSGTTVVITQLEDRTYQVDGNALASGDVVEAGNGNRYRLTVDEMGWSWEFLAPDPVPVALGTSGDLVFITQQEDGTYEANGQPLGAERIVEADNGNRYRLTLDDTGWAWEFLPPDSFSLDLGTSGTTVVITQLEDRSYQVDGQPLGAERIVEADNGNRYRLTLDDTGWAWEFLPPDSFSLDLGTSGTTVVITQLEDRTYQVDGNALASGDVVEADNGNRYRLTLDDTGWAWEFLPPGSFSLDLGTSGTTVVITQLEDRTYQVNGNALASGDVVEADNGNRYRLTLGDSGWLWEFLAPDAVAVALGTTGDFVFITQQEDGTYEADGQPLGADRIVEAGNGNKYRLVLEATGWSWEFVAPEPVRVQLGTSGDVVSITQQENGRYLVDGNPLPGDRIVKADNGNRYRLRFDFAGWSWEFVAPEPVRVELGTSGDSVVITQLEDRTYYADGQPLAEDRIVEADNGNTYRLTLDATGWSWEFVPPNAVMVRLGTSGDTVSITQLENGSYLADGNPLPGDRIVDAANGNRYRLTLDVAGWRWDFVPPEPVSVELGTSGDTVSITQLEDRSYLVDGRPLASGGVVPASNGNRYRLTLDETGWTWEFVPPGTEAVTLGTSGDSVLITQLEDGSYLADGKPLPGDRIVDAANGNRYRLILRGSMWSWEFVPPDAFVLELGTSGDTVSITQMEDRSYQVDGRPLASGGIVPASNGNRYRLILRGSVWSWEFIEPSPVAVSLGTSGTAVLIKQLEDGTYLVNDQPLADDRVVTAANGHRYRLTLGPTGWSAAFATTPFPVSLGRLGGTRTVELREDGKYWVGNTEVTDGHIITGDNQKRYKLVFRSGVWQGVHQPDEISVPVTGSNEVVVLFQLEDDTYYFGNREVQTGDTVTDDTGNEYTLTLDSTTGMWTAMIEVQTVTVELGTSGDAVVLTRLRDGTYERDGTPFSTGSRVRADDGVLYRLVDNLDGTWTAYVDQTGGVPPSPGGPTTRRTDNLETVEALPSANPPTFRTADGSPDQDEGTTLVVAGASGSTTPQEYSIYDLVGRGVVTESRTYIDAARAEIQKIRADIQRKVDAGVFENGALDPHDEILGSGKSWDQLKTALAIIFGSSVNQTAAAESFLGDAPTGRRDDTLDPDEVADVLEVFDEILDSLSTLTKFEDEVYGDLVTTAGNSLDLSAEEVYEAAYSKLQFGSSRNTRFAAYAIQHDNGSASGAVSWDVGAFAYSPLDVSTRSMLPHRGEAEFEGETIAVQASITDGGDTTLYSGDIELKVRFSIGRVLGLITNLRDEDNNLWTYNGTAVESIRLPIGAMDTGDATFDVTGTSDLRFVSDTPDSTFQGQFVGDDSDEADAVLGTWTIAEVASVQGAVSGAFGAEYSRTRTSSRPELESSPLGSRVETFIDFEADAQGEVTLGSFVGIDPSRLYSRGTSIYRSTDANQELSVTLQTDESLKLTVTYRKTDFTRYGVWEQEKTEADATASVEQQGVFAYSYLEPTVFSTQADSDHVYPQNVSATYSGQTIAQDRADDPAIYTGTIEMTVNWMSTIGSAELDSVVIRNLRSGSNYFAIDGETVDRVAMTGSVTFQGANDGIRFVSTTSSGMEVWYRDPLLNRSRLGGSHDGNFMGLSIDGPVAVIGKWSVNSTSNDTLIEGAYGAHLQP